MSGPHVEEGDVPVPKLEDASVRLGGTEGLVRALLVVGAVMVALAPSIAAEPDGVLHFDTRWDERDAAVRDRDLFAAGARVRVAVEPSVVLRDVTIVVRVPPVLEVDSGGERPVRADVAADGTVELRMHVAELGRATPTAFDLVFRVREGSGAIARVEVSGRTDDGRIRTDAIGIPVGHPGSRGELRHGARVFPTVAIDPPAHDGDPQ